MSPLVHKVYIYTLVVITLCVTIFLSVNGFSYYGTSLEERFYHPHHAWFKPSGVFGHGLGIVGTLLILIGVFGYIALKRYKFLARFGRLKYWLEFHIFLCTVGPIMILFHTAFKFGGIVSISFWSMVAVVASGVVGRFIYIQIPRTIEGRELSLGEIHAMQVNLGEMLRTALGLNEDVVLQIVQSTKSDKVYTGNFLTNIWVKSLDDSKRVSTVRTALRTEGLDAGSIRKVTRLLRNEISLNNRIERLQTMVQLFKYWHVAHLPFAIIMLVIMVIHVGVTLAFGYKWIF